MDLLRFASAPTFLPALFPMMNHRTHAQYSQRRGKNDRSCLWDYLTPMNRIKWPNPEPQLCLWARNNAWLEGGVYLSSGSSPLELGKINCKL